MITPVFEVSEKVSHKPGCTTKENGDLKKSKMLQISDLGSRGIVLSM